MIGLEKQALSYLPSRLAVVAVKKASLWKGEINEIRLREYRLMSITVRGKNISCEVVCTVDDIKETVQNLCSGSLYSHAEEIREGVITTDYGIRAGVCGRAVILNGKLDCVRDVCSINIRIPRCVKGVADKVYDLCRDRKNVLIFAAPGGGKTTILRELIPLLSGEETKMRVSVIDTRYELCSGLNNGDLTDVFYGYPRYEGIVSAVRTMTPEYIICDEISDDRDADAILFAHHSGVSVCVTSHGRDIETICKSSCVGRLIKEGVFDYLYGIDEKGEAMVKRL